MKRLLKLSRCLVFAVCGVSVFWPSSCSDEVDESNLYTFTGDMISGYLAKSDSFQMYSYCLNKVRLSGKSQSTFADLLSTRGNYTVFAPTDEAMHLLLDSIYNQKDFPVENVSDSVMEKIVRSGIIDNGDGEAYRVEDFVEGAIQKTNADDRYLTIEYDTLNGRAITKVNGDARIIMSNIETENGYVHAVDRVVMLSNAYVSQLLGEASNMHIFSILLNATGWADSLEFYRDEVYEAEAENYPDREGNSHTWGRDAYVPHHRYFKYTILAEPDSVFHEKWGIPMPVIEAGVITNEETIRERLRQKCREAYPLAVSEGLTDPGNAENQFVAYHLLKIGVPYQWLVVHRKEYGYSYKNPTRLSICCDNYWETMTRVHRRLVKMTEGPSTGGIKINRCNKYDSDTYEETEVSIQGIGVSPTNGGNDNNALNGFYYPIDDILIYSDDVPDKVLNQRIRIDWATYQPEIINNNFFLSDDYAFLLPKGYLEYVTINNEQTDYHYLSGVGVGWYNMYGDENSITGIYDYTLRVPPVPFDGTWEIRLDYSYSENRGMAQLYFGTDKQNLQAQGLPLDERIHPRNPSIGWVVYEEEDPDLVRERDKSMRAKGYMMSIKHEGVTSNGEIVTQSLYSVTAGDVRARRIFYTGNMKSDDVYYIRVKGVLTNDQTLFTHDYIELVPKSVYNGDTPEDAW